MQLSGEIELLVVHENRSARVMLDTQRRAVLIEPRFDEISALIRTHPEAREYLTDVSAGMRAR
jgi:hypothetical protein